MNRDERIKLIAMMAASLYGQADDPVKVAEKMLLRIESEHPEQPGTPSKGNKA